MSDVMSLNGAVTKNMTHQTPAPIDYFGGLMKKPNKKLHELILIVKLLIKQNLADDIGGCIVEQQVGIHGLTWQKKGQNHIEAKKNVKY